MSKHNLFESPSSIDQTFPDMSADDLVLNPEGQSNSGKSGKSVRMRERIDCPDLTEAERTGFLREYNGGQLYKEPDTVPHLDGAELFGDDSPVVWDFGCGRGEHIVALAMDNPETNYVGVDLHYTSLALGTRAAASAGLSNVRFVKADGGLLIPRIPDGSAAAASVLFPAPLPQNDGSFRGMPQPKFVEQIHRTLEIPGAPFEFATDSEPYINYRARKIGETGLFTLDPNEYTVAVGQSSNPTRYQMVWERKNIPTRRLVMRKK